MPSYSDLVLQGAQTTHKRHLEAHKVGDIDVKLVLMPAGFCQWCGKPLTGRAKRFCPEVKDHTATYIAPHNSCSLAFWQMWYTIPRFKRAVYVRDNCTCQICGAKPTKANRHGVIIPDFDRLAIDHIHPYSKGGETVIENLQVACRKCNSRKRDKLEFVPQPELLEVGSPETPPPSEAIKP